MSVITDSIYFPCPACGAPENYHCASQPGVYSVNQEGDPWCHSLRTQVLQFAAAQNFQGFTLVSPQPDVSY